MCTYTHRGPVSVAEGGLDLLIRDQRVVFEIVSKAERLDVLLESRRDLPLIPPEAVAREFVFEGSIRGLDFAEFFVAAGGGAQG